MASCLYKFMTEHIENGGKQFYIFSDNCGLQNRNRIIATIWWYILQKFDVDIITHSFLEVGHTQNENDAVHAAIERASRKISLFVPDQWLQPGQHNPTK